MILIDKFATIGRSNACKPKRLSLKLSPAMILLWLLVFACKLSCAADRLPQLHFKVDQSYLVYHMLVNNSPSRFVTGTPEKDVVAFENLAWKNDQSAYQFLQHGVTEYMILEHENLGSLGARAEKLIQSMINEPSFKPLHEETLNAMNKVQKEWDEDFSKTSSIMNELTGLNFEEHEKFDIYITHPSQKNGLGGPKIRISYRQDFPHYNTVYLWHEIMHSYLPSDSRDAVVNVEHCVIQLLTDNELRSRLNGSVYPPFEGHEETKTMMEKLLPSWRAYLHNPHKDIRAYLKTAKEILGKQQ